VQEVLLPVGMHGNGSRGVYVGAAGLFTGLFCEGAVGNKVGKVNGAAENGVTEEGVAGKDNVAGGNVVSEDGAVCGEGVVGKVNGSAENDVTPDDAVCAEAASGVINASAKRAAAIRPPLTIDLR